MGSAPTETEKIRRLNWRIAHNGANTIFVQLTFFGSIYILFLNELGLPKTRIGFLLSMVPFSGVLSLFVAPAVARMGVKRVFVICWALRTLVAAFLLLIPWTMAQYGAEPAFLLIALLIVAFALCRTVGETGAVPWELEVIPAAMRGKYRGVSTIVETLAAMLAIVMASYALGRITGLTRYMVPMGVGVLFGAISVGLALLSPGGAPSQERKTAHFRQLRTALQDGNFRRHLGSQGLIFLSFGFISFMPLFMKDQAGLHDHQIILLQVGGFSGSLLSSYLWGWVTDRYGGKPVMLSSLYILALVPLCWLLMPRFSEWSYPAAMAIAVALGVAVAGWSIGDYRLIYSDIIPAESKTAYTAIYYTWWGLAGGCGPLLAGQVLDQLQGLEGRFLIFTLDAYAPLFLATPLLAATGMALLAQLKVENAMPTRSFMNLFLRGNPFLAFRALVRYRRARNERMRVLETEHMGEARSPLNVEELLDALADPSFHVRYEAVVSIARTRPDERLVTALELLVVSNDPDLGPAACWALGRMGATKAVPALRDALESDSELLRTFSARSLAVLGDTGSVPALIRHFRAAADGAPRVAYAGALGMLQAHEAAGELALYLDEQTDEGVRGELALALARLIGREGDFVRLWRQTNGHPGTALAQQMRRLERRSRQGVSPSREFIAACVDCARALAQGELEEGARLLSALAQDLPAKTTDSIYASLLRACVGHLEKHDGAPRREYLILSLLIMQAALEGG